MSYFTIINLKLGLNGFIISFYIKVIVEFFLLIYSKFKYNKIINPKLELNLDHLK